MARFVPSRTTSSRFLTRNVVLKADYSSALALLLRYPAPSDPYGPVTFVEDALYLQRNLTAEAGATLVSKYSGKPPARGHQVPSHRGTHTPRNSMDLERTRSPMRSPGRILQDSGGLEGLLQEAAKGVYRRSEQWGLSQAFRSAVQGLHSGSNTPRRSSNAYRLTDENQAAGSFNNLASKIQALEDRNKTLAKLLQESIEDISAQAKEFEKEKLEAKADKLTLSVAKLQFLQVHMENSAMPLGSDSADPESQRIDQDQKSDADEKSMLSPSRDGFAPVASPLPISARQATTRRQNSQDSASQSPTRAPIRRPAHISTVPRITKTESPQQSPFQTSRPSLAQSSFSWMLGEGENKSSFVSASPFSPERDRKVALRGKAGFLFGDEKEEATHSKLSQGKAMPGMEDDEGFTLGTLKGSNKR